MSGCWAGVSCWASPAAGSIATVSNRHTASIPVEKYCEHMSRKWPFSVQLALSYTLTVFSTSGSPYLCFLSLMERMCGKCRETSLALHLHVRFTLDKESVGNQASSHISPSSITQVSGVSRREPVRGGPLFSAPLNTQWKLKENMTRAPSVTSSLMLSVLNSILVLFIYSTKTPWVRTWHFSVLCHTEKNL